VEDTVLSANFRTRVIFNKFLFPSRRFRKREASVRYRHRKSWRQFVSLCISTTSHQEIILRGQILVLHDNYFQYVISFRTMFWERHMTANLLFRGQIWLFGLWLVRSVLHVTSIFSLSEMAASENAGKWQVKRLQNSWRFKLIQRGGRVPKSWFLRWLDLLFPGWATLHWTKKKIFYPRILGK